MMGSKGFRNPEIMNILESRRLVSVSVCDVITGFGGNTVVTRVNGSRIPSALVQVFVEDTRR